MVTQSVDSALSIGVTPVRSAERIDALDIARGFALFGILLINIVAFARPGAPPFFSTGEPLADRIVLLALLIFVESKFFTVFSLLFGIGFGIQLLRAEARQTAFIPFFRRRLFFLGMFGVAHILLLWDGDILLLYAIVGLLMIPFRRLAPRRLLQWVIGLLAVPLLLYILLFAGIAIAGSNPETATSIVEVEGEIQAVFSEAGQQAIATYGGNDYLAMIASRLAGYIETIFLLVTRIPTVLAMFLLGLYVARSGILTRLDEHQALLRRVRRVGLVLGLGIAGLLGIATFFLPTLLAFVAAFFNQAIAGPLTALGYAATIVLLLERRPMTGLLKPLAAYGQMALTNYLLQSVLCGFVFYGYGFGLVGRLSLPAAMLIALTIHAVLIAFSLIWLRSFRYGPMEWLWRSLNYGKAQSIRRSQIQEYA